MGRPKLIEISAGGLQAGDYVTFDDGKTFHRVARLTRHRGYVVLTFAGMAPTKTLHEDASVQTRE